MDSSKVDLNLLVALDALLAERNVTRAARRLGLSQPALSAQLARLRDLLGDPLFLPAQRGVTPTARALELEAPVRRALDQVHDVMARGRGFDPATADLTVAIACSDYMQVAVIAPLALDLRISAPKLRLAIRQLDGNLLGQADGGRCGRPGHDHAPDGAAIAADATIVSRALCHDRTATASAGEGKADAR